MKPAPRVTQRASACACALLTALVCAPLAAAAAAEDADKRAEMAPAPFVLGSRYGRSPPRLLQPRNDRFFMGSRYGKRAELEAAVGAALRPPQLATLQAAGWRAPPAPPAPAAPAPAPLACQYTGLLALYRCRRLAPRYPPADIRRYDDEPNVTDEE